jgi:hypothetical protein
MPHKVSKARVDKLAKLVAVFDQFHESIAGLQEPKAKRLVENWTNVRAQYTTSTEAPRSALASGMEQGLRETPLILGSLPQESRMAAGRALSNAISTHYPEFLIKDRERIEKIKTRGSIRSESEYHLIRYQVDVLEGQVDQAEALQSFYLLLDKFEGRGA